MDEQGGTKPASPSPVPGPKKYGLEYYNTVYRSYTLAILYLDVVLRTKPASSSSYRVGGQSVASNTEQFLDTVALYIASFYIFKFFAFRILKVIDSEFHSMIPVAHKLCSLLMHVENMPAHCKGGSCSWNMTLSEPAIWIKVSGQLDPISVLVQYTHSWQPTVLYTVWRYSINSKSSILHPVKNI